jgi:hypothetical protein
MNIYQQFWDSLANTSTGCLSQLERYKVKKSPDYILKFIEMGGGPKMGCMLEKFSRFQFQCLKTRFSGKNQSGYDHRIEIGDKNIFIEQKSSGHWGIDDYKWQHVEPKHEWKLLLLCGIDYNDIRFWVMDRTTFNTLVSEKKIVKQGGENSEQGMWFSYSDVKDSITLIQTNDELLQIAEKVSLEQA